MAHSSTSHVRLNSTSNTTLRSSCNACTEAKIGCTKEKPTCSRCARRGEPCVYSATRRAGRRGTDKQRSTDNQRFANDPSPSASRKTSIQGSVGPELAPKSTFTFPSPETMPSGLDLFCGDYSSSTYRNHDDQLQAANAAAHGQPPVLLPADIEELLASLPFMPMGDEQSTNPVESEPWHGVAGAFSEHDEASSSGAMDTGVGDYFTKSLFGPRMSPMATYSPSPSFKPLLPTSNGNPKSGPEQQHSSITSVHAQYSQYSTSQARRACVVPTCGCFEQSLALLKDLTPLSAVAATDGGSPSRKGSTAAQSSVTFESVMSRNSAVLETVGQILQCTAAHDHSVSLVLPMIVLKVLGWYAAAASPTSLSSNQDDDVDMDDEPELPLPLTVQPPSKADLGDDLQNENPERAACQLVFAKVNTVRRIVSRVLTQLHTAEGKVGNGEAPTKPRSIIHAAQDLLFTGTFFDAVTQRNITKCMDVNVRERLRELCQNLLETLLEK